MSRDSVFASGQISGLNEFIAFCFFKIQDLRVTQDKGLLNVVRDMNVRGGIRKRRL